MKLCYSELFFNIVLYHEDGGNKEIIALHASHNTKTSAKFQATSEVESRVMHTTHEWSINITSGEATSDVIDHEWVI